MSLFRWTNEVKYGAIDRIEAEIAAVGDFRWVIRVSRASGRAWLDGFFHSRTDARAAWSRLAAVIKYPGVAGRPACKRLHDRAWRESYRNHFTAWHFGRVHWAPIWRRATYRLPYGAVPVWLDPGMAFGTGNHPTTRLCCERLIEFVNSGEGGARDGSGSTTVIDAGCGSGILAITAARLGLGPVIGLDVDPDAIRVSRQNAALNGLSGKIRWLRKDLASGLAGQKAALVLANIQADVLQRARQALTRAVAAGGWLVLGGLLASEIPVVRSVFSSAGTGWKSRTQRRGDWADLVLVRPAGAPVRACRRSE